MDKKYAIFDMDGTLVDSMRYWKHLASEYLESENVKHIPFDLLDQIESMTMLESAALFHNKFGLCEVPERIADKMNIMMDEHYRSDIPLKSGVKNYLDILRKNGVKMCVASASADYLMEVCLKRLGIFKYFDFLISCEDVGVSKNRPDIYYAAAKKLGAHPPEVAVYEDALYAVKTAKEANFYVIGVYDENESSYWNELMDIADEVIRSW